MAEPVAMVAIAQVYASDVTGFSFPEDTDLLQALWCPVHAYDSWFSPAATCVRWRRLTNVGDVLTPPPAAPVVGEGVVPIPCVLDPEPITEYPWTEELPPELQTAIHDWQDDYPAYHYGLSIASGCKVGGGMTWGATDMGEPPVCDTCGSPARLILQLDSSEWGGESDRKDGPPRWQPIEDIGLHDAAYWEAINPTGLRIGDTHGGFYGCTTDPNHPTPIYIQ